MKSLYGEVLRTSLKTAIIGFDHSFVHPKYKKRISLHKKLMVHDEIGVNVGDRVKVISCRPYSKRKRHIIEEKL